MSREYMNSERAVYCIPYSRKVVQCPQTIAKEKGLLRFFANKKETSRTQCVLVDTRQQNTPVYIFVWRQLMFRSQDFLCTACMVTWLPL